MAQYDDGPSCSYSTGYPSSSSSISASPMSTTDPDALAKLQKIEVEIERCLDKFSERDKRKRAVLFCELHDLITTATDLRVNHLMWNPLTAVRTASPKRKAEPVDWGRANRSMFRDHAEAMKKKPKMAQRAPRRGKQTKNGTDAAKPAEAKPKRAKKAAKAPARAPSIIEIPVVPDVPPPASSPTKRGRPKKVPPPPAPVPPLNVAPSTVVAAGTAGTGVVGLMDIALLNTFAQNGPIANGTAKLQPVGVHQRRRTKKVPFESDEPSDAAPAPKKKKAKIEEPVYCICRMPSSGKMVLCDNAHCELKWFHFTCLRMRKTPPGKWYCPSCRQEGDPSTLKVQA
ncbi:chromodomain-helicase-DNA-binding protein 4-like [Paramacrobiotus metropolitanus]|uniref:chromodomain-helicase-DNA-binding protein 4-like n=1 Tax=Paramacrobiotus metropolitanus TaxID=2943436 RepID=UPI002445A720|nr:chromodomain-helicase-DNA-binding protein 4-like [Paramacrobiotus metropolitanus]